MRSHNVSYFLLCLCSSVLVYVSCKNVTKISFSLESVRKGGISFIDIVNKVKNENLRISSQCMDQLTILLKQPEALQRMADAWSKFPYTGAYYAATRSDWANYDECINVDVQDKDDRVVGKFCTWGFIIPELTSSDPTANAWRLSYCIPDKCTSEDLINATRLPIFNDLICSTKLTDTELDTGAIVTIVVLASVVFFMIASTIYDVYLHYTDKKTPHVLLTAFSVYSNGKKLISVTKHSKEQILCFNGLKFISMGWIIYGHGMIAWYAAPLQVEEARVQWQTSRYNQYVSTAHISVDTFFYISGFLMSYLYFKQTLSKKPLLSQVKRVPSLILHRYLRLTPANGMGFLVTVYLFKYFNDGPLYSYGVHNGLIEPCQKYWWTFFLYIQNYYNFHFGDSLCIPTTWYLSADMQLFLVAPLVIIPVTLLYRRSLKSVMCALLGVNLVCLVIPIITKLTWQDYDPDFHEYDFHGKLISYFIGIMMGIYMRHERNKHYVIKRWVNVLLWFLALSAMHSIMWYRGEVQLHYGYVAKSLCYSFTRPIWCIGLCWITFACVNGYGGVINWFLSCGFMQLGGKLTYCVYIVHGLVIANAALAHKYRFYFRDWTVFYFTCGHFIVSMLIATVWSLAFESPMIAVERTLFGAGTPRTHKPHADGGHENPQKVT